jgi:uncharacterized protein YqgV (UPF0045/DUF77 family)
MKVHAQLSVYPLRQEHLTPAIATVDKVLAAHGLQHEVGPLSTYVTGDSAALFTALREAFDRDAAQGEVVMSVTVAKAR